MVETMQEGPVCGCGCARGDILLSTLPYSYQALIVKEGARVMSLTDGTSKMSKSDPVEGSRINLTDPPDVIAKKVSTLSFFVAFSTMMV